MTTHDIRIIAPLWSKDPRLKTCSAAGKAIFGRLLFLCGAEVGTGNTLELATAPPRGAKLFDVFKHFSESEVILGVTELNRVGIIDGNITLEVE